MTGVVVFLAIACLILLVIAGSIVVAPVGTSSFELNRRKRLGEKAVSREAAKTAHHADLVSVQRMATSLLLIASVLLLVVAWGWPAGMIIGFFIVLSYGMLGRIGPLHHFAQNLYERHETALLTFVSRYERIFAVLRGSTPERPDERLASKEELLHLVEHASHVLTTDERSLIVHGLSFSHRRVKEVMTPRAMIDSIKRHEILGPLVLDQLHKTGHSRFPVIHGDIDHIVGILYVPDVLTIDGSKKHTAKVDSAMRPDVVYIQEDQTLDRALAALLEAHHHLLVVVNETSETTGIITLKDVVAALLGRRPDDIPANG